MIIRIASKNFKAVPTLCVNIHDPNTREKHYGVNVPLSVLCSFRDTKGE